MICEFSEGSLVVTFIDQGKSFDFDRVDVPDLKADLSERKIGGLGIYLMHKLMDEVRASRTEAGNEFLMKKIYSKMN